VSPKKSVRSVLLGGQLALSDARNIPDGIDAAVDFYGIPQG